MKIGKEKPRMAAKPVIVEGYDTVTVPPKAGTALTTAKDKIVLNCKHPDSKDNLALGKIKYERRGKMEVSALWVTLDEDGDISSESALAYFLRFYGVNELSAIVGLKIQTVQDTDSGFLIIKAY